MRSARPKVLHRLAGRQPIAACSGRRRRRWGQPRTIVVTGHGADEVERRRRAPGLRVRAPGAAARHRPCGAAGGAAARRRRHHAGPQRRRAADRGRHAAARWSPPARATRLALLTVELRRPQRLRPRRRAAGGADARHRRAQGRQRRRSARSSEIYTGIMAAPTAALKRWLAALNNDNAARRVLPDRRRRPGRRRRRARWSARSRARRDRGAGRQQPAQLADLERALPARAAPTR